MLDFRLKRAQVALADGRLDEAFELFRDSSLQEQRAGQKLLTKLSVAFIRRGQGHLTSQRLAPALDDCLRAEKLAGNLPEIVELRSMIASQIETERAGSRQRSEQLAKAQEQMQNGWLSAGRKILAESEDQQAQNMLKNADMLELQNDSAAGRIKQALKTGQIELAARIYQNSSLCGNMSPESADILSLIQRQAQKKLQDCLAEGRLHAAASFLAQINGHVAQSEMIQPLQKVVEYCHKAVGQINAGAFSEAEINLRRAQTLLPKAKWLTEAIGQVKSTADTQRHLQAGPLGIFEQIDLSESPEIVPAPVKTARPAPEFLKTPEIDRHNAMGTKMRFILQMDGIGAYYVFGSDRVTMGPVSSTTRSDIELVTAPDVVPKQIERVEGDYFIGQTGGITSHGSRQLLSDGDRVELSPRCRFKFTQSNPASSTACLIPSSARFPRADITGVILMGREILIGPERNNHIQSGQLPEAMVLFLQDGQIRCRTQQPVIVEGRSVSAGAVLPMDKRIEIGDVQLVLSTQNL